jgi:chitodextrinase
MTTTQPTYLPRTLSYGALALSLGLAIFCIHTAGNLPVVGESNTAGVGNLFPTHEPAGMTTFIHTDGSVLVPRGMSAQDAWTGASGWGDAHTAVISDPTNPTGSGYSIEKRWYGPESTTVKPGATTEVVPVGAVKYPSLPGVYKNRNLAINGETVRIDSYKNGVFTLAKPLSSAPVAGDEVTILGLGADAAGAPGILDVWHWSKINPTFTPTKKVYVRMQVWFSPNWETDPILNGMKYFYLKTSKRNINVLWTANGASKDWRFYWETLTANHLNSSGKYVNDGGWVPSSMSELGTWHTVEAIFTMNSDLDTADGGVQIWVDGKLSTNRNDLLIVADDDTDYLNPDFDGIEFYNIRGSNKHYFERDDYYRLGELYVSGLETGAPTPTDTTPPATPTTPVASSITTSSVALSWSSVSSATSYKLYRNNTYLKTLTTLATTDTGLSSGTTYSYTLSALDSSGNESSRSSARSVTTLTPPPPADPLPTTTTLLPPTIAALTPALSSVTLTWSGVSGATSYQVYRNGTLITTTNSTTFTDTGLTANTTYTYFLQAKNADGVSTASLSKSTRTLGTILPETPLTGEPVTSLSSPRSLSLRAQATTIKLTWHSVTDATSYAIYRNGGLLTSTSETSYTDTGLLPDTTYSYYVVALSGSVSSAPGETKHTTTRPQAGAEEAVPATTPAIAHTFSHDLSPYSRSSEVTVLQNFLITRGYLASGNATGYFGPLTTQALQNFQRAQGIVTSGTPATTGFGNFGPQTRQAVNSLLGSTSSGTEANQALIESLQKQITELTKQVEELVRQLGEME